jgi:hypothetical protein
MKARHAIMPRLREKRQALAEDAEASRDRRGELDAALAVVAERYCCRKAGMGMPMANVVAATPMPPSQVLGGTVAV